MKKTLCFKSCVEFPDEIEYELHYPTGKNEVVFTGAEVGAVCGGFWRRGST
ncbi:MAG: hypothetical protein K0B11_17245 [Mariniphaga sp.]|nr:hypothetical protein [Mariniphaga sp.]